MAESKVKMALGIRPFLTFIFFVVAITMFIILNTQSAETHGSPIIDGAFTGDWCARASAGLPGPDTLTTLMPPGCPLGTEFFWDDWDAINYGGGIADTIGWLVGGGPGAPMTDLETDMDFFVTTADNSTVFFAVALGPFPSTGGSPPHVQIAIDIDGAPMGNFFFYDPLPVGLIPAGLASLPAPLPSDYLITTDVMAGTGFLWEATTAPGTWTLVGPVPLGWSGATGMPGVVEIAVPWGMFGPGPAFGPTIPAHMTVMSTHSAAFAGLSDAPMFPEDDVMTELGAGFTTSPDVCPPGPPSGDCEMFIGPGGGGGSADAFIAITYPAIPTPTPTNTPTPSLTPTHTPSPTDTLTPTPSLTPTNTPAPTDTPTPSLTPTLTPGPTDTSTPTATTTATATPVVDYDWYLPVVVDE